MTMSYPVWLAVFVVLFVVASSPLAFPAKWKFNYQWTSSLFAGVCLFCWVAIGAVGSIRLIQVDATNYELDLGFAYIWTFNYAMFAFIAWMAGKEFVFPWYQRRMATTQ